MLFLTINKEKRKPESERSECADDFPRNKPVSLRHAVSIRVGVSSAVAACKVVGEVGEKKSYILGKIRGSAIQSGNQRCTRRSAA
jgi:hypothetical protein